MTALRTRPGIRQVTVTAHGLFALLQALSAGQVRAGTAETIPAGAALTGVTWDPQARSFTVGVFHHAWPADTPDELPASFVTYLGDHAGWSAPTSLNR